MPTKLPLSFYRRPTKTVARELLGKTLVHQLSPTVKLAGRIVETEAYLGIKDPACHSYRPDGPRRTARTEPMFWEGGYSYIYFTYGMYFCFCVVTEKKDVPEAVLIRAVEPTLGTDLMFKSRNVKKPEQLCSGPGKLCISMGLNAKQNGILLNGRSLWLEDSDPVEKSKIVTCERIGISHEVAKTWPLRYYVRDSRHVSKRAT